MSNRYLREIKKYYTEMNNFPGFNLGSLMVILLSVFLIIISTFTQIKYGDFYYVPQIPTIIFVGALLGPQLGKFPVLIYIAAGLLGVPIFASGGGFNYYVQYGFGFIIGYIACVHVVGNILSKQINLKNILKADLAGVLMVHIFGLFILCSRILLQKQSTQLIFAWGLELSGKTIILDLLFGLIAIVLARFSRKFLWIAMN